MDLQISAPSTSMRILWMQFHIPADIHSQIPIPTRFELHRTSDLGAEKLTFSKPKYKLTFDLSLTFDGSIYKKHYFQIYLTVLYLSCGLMTFSNHTESKKWQN